MSYPEPKYFGNGGEVTARVRRADATPELPRPGGAASYLATGATTAGKFGLYRWDMGPERAGANAHFHRTFSESFFVLSGAVQLSDGTGWIDSQPGDFAFVPEAGVHGFRNESGEPASLLILFAPGAPREAYFEGLSRWRRDVGSRATMNSQSSSNSTTTSTWKCRTTSYLPIRAIPRATWRTSWDVLSTIWSRR